MSGQRNGAGINGEALAVQKGRHLTSIGPHLISLEEVTPKVEVIAQCEGPLDARLDMDDPVAGVRVAPVEAGAGDHEGTVW